MIFKLFKIFICVLLLTAFFMGLLGVFIMAICFAGLFLLSIIGLYYLIKKTIQVLYIWYKKIALFREKHTERFKWILFGVFTAMLAVPILRDLISIISWENIIGHFYLLCLGLLLFVYVAWFLYQRIKKMFEEYKKANVVFLFESKDNELTFIDYVWSSCDVNKESLHWLRTFATIFCYPFFFISYVISLSEQWNKIFNVVSFASLFIALYSIWYAVNLKKNEKSQDDNQNSELMINLSPTPEEASSAENTKWKQLF